MTTRSNLTLPPSGRGEKGQLAPRARHGRPWARSQGGPLAEAWEHGSWDGSHRHVTGGPHGARALWTNMARAEHLLALWESRVLVRGRQRVSTAQTPKKALGADL